MNKNSEVPSVMQEGLSASVQVLPLPAGLYLFSVTSADPIVKRSDGQLQLPALHVGLGPGVRAEQVEFIAGPSTNGAWLFAHDDLLVTKVHGSGATLVLNSIRGAGGEVLSIKVERLDTRADVLASMMAGPAGAAAKPAARGPTALGDALPVHIAAHIRSRGDMTFTDTPWAGRVAPGLWIESFSIRPLERFGADDIEYKGLTGSGFETPWLSDDEMCGTKGMAVPLVGFAVRLKPGAQSANYDCEYSGYFKSGVTVGPLRNGAPCRSTVANDPLEGLQIRIIRRSTAGALSAAAQAARKAVTHAPRAAARGPSFGKFREAGGRAAAARRAAVKPTKAPKSKAGSKARAKPSRGASAARSPGRRRP